MSYEKNVANKAARLADAVLADANNAGTDLGALADMVGRAPDGFWHVVAVKAGERRMPDASIPLARQIVLAACKVGGMPKPADPFDGLA